MKAQIYSFFSGAGFLDLGFENSGFEVALANEVYEPFSKAYAFSRKKMGISAPIHGIDLSSIETFFTDDKLKALKTSIAGSRKAGAIVGFIGGPPCPDFSVAGKNKGKEGENGKLSRSYIDLVIATLPDFFLFENVKGLWRTARHRAFFEELKRDLSNAGYSLSERLINSVEYGVPQDRDRIILLGFRGGKSGEPLSKDEWEKHTKYSREEVFSKPWPNQSEVVTSLPRPQGVIAELTVGHWFERNQVDKHPNANDAFVPRAGLERFKATLEGDVSRKSYKRLHRWRYSPTVAYGNNEVHLHPWLNRRLSAAEALALQSLPREFVLPDDMTLSAKFKTIGNGVPYLAAQGLAETVMAKLNLEFG
jgi:DNA (cytosine-5)-methyltransferase 1